MTVAYLELIGYGLIQALTEFIPVSSSGHLLLVANWTVARDDLLELVVWLNLGSLLALIYYFRRPISRLLAASSGDLWLKLILASLPAAGAGWFLADWFDQFYDNVAVIAVLLLAGGLLMILVRPAASGKDRLQQLTWADSGLTGLAQSLALIPGTSRAGVTILAGFGRKMTARLATAWSFLLGIPIIAGALLRVGLSDSGRAFGADNLPGLILGNLVSFTVSLLVIGLALALVERYGLRPFGYYRIGFGLLLLGLLGLDVL